TGHGVDARANELGHVESVCNRADDLFGRMRAGFGIEVGRTRRRWLAERAHGARRRALPELARRVRVEEKRPQYAGFNYDVSPTGEPFGVEPPRGESRGAQRIVDDAQRLGTDYASKPVTEEGHAAIDGGARDRRREMAKQRRCGLRVEDD